MTDPSSRNPLSTNKPWDIVAAGYDEFTRPMFAAFAQRATQLLGLEPGSRVLDVACGPGTMSLALAAEGHQVDAIDFSPQMLAQLQAKLEPGASNEGAHIAPRLMDGQQLDFADGQFDAGASMFGLMFFPDRDKGLRELFRVTRPGGRIVLSSWLPLSQVPDIAWAFGVMSILHPPSDEPAPKPVPVLEDPETITQELTAAGFRNVTVEACEHSSPLSADVGQFWEVLEQSTAPIALLREGMTQQRWAELSERCVEHLRATRSEQLGDQFTMKAWLAVADRP